MGILSLVCKQCGDKLDAPDNKEFAFCMSCGTKHVIKDEVTNITNVNNVTQNITKNIYGGEEDKSIAELIEEGQLYFKLEQFEDASKVFKKWVDKDKQNWEAWFWYARAGGKWITCEGERHGDPEPAFKAAYKLASDEDKKRILDHLIDNNASYYWYMMSRIAEENWYVWHEWAKLEWDEFKSEGRFKKAYKLASDENKKIVIGSLCDIHPTKWRLAEELDPNDYRVWFAYIKSKFIMTHENDKKLKIDDKAICKTLEKAYKLADNNGREEIIKFISDGKTNGDKQWVARQKALYKICDKEIKRLVKKYK